EKGAPGALEAGKALPPATRREVLETAGRWLLALRLYPAAAPLLAAAVEAGPKSPPLARLAALAGKAVRFEELKWPNQPTTPVKRLLLNLVLGAPPEASKDLFAARALEFAPGAAADALAQAERFRAALEGEAFPVETVTDLFLAGVVLSTEGDDGKGYPVGVRFEGVPATAWFVISEGGGYRVLASAESTPGLAGLGAEALARAARENPVEAKALLGWARRALAGQKAAGAPREVFASIWPGPNINPATEFRLAVSCLLAEGGGEKTVKHLQEQRGLALSDALAWDLDRVTVAANATAGRWKDNLLMVKRWEDRRVHAAALADIRVEALTQLQQWPELREASFKYADAAPDELRAIEYAAEGALHAGDFDAVDAVADRLVEPARPGARLLISRARAALYRRGPPDRRGIEWAEKALRLEAPSPDRQLTLAALYAETGRVADAREILAAALGAGAGLAPPIAWYVQGRLAESYGLPGSARRAYERVVAAPRAPADDPAALARRRLGELTPGPKSPGKPPKTR
ncbi:MAG: tetratricopeptide repeat protein, partial [Myxococcaceae bacterium]